MVFLFKWSWVIRTLAGVLLLHFAMIVLSSPLQNATELQDSTNSATYYPIDYQSIMLLLKHCYTFGMPLA